ncbi:TPA: prophage tail fiber N-terminal domain-containing protein [Salmonella enterica subsp. enterica serovar Java]
MTVIKGTITTATGDPVAGAIITLTAINTSNGILDNTVTNVFTDSGKYEFTVMPGCYAVRLTTGGQEGCDLGTIRIYDDSPDGTLNTFLTLTKTDLSPDALHQYEAWGKQAKENADRASEVLEEARNTTIKGTKGETGDSAYTFWKSQQKDGADTSEAAYLAFQEGKKGDKGDPGPSAYDIWKSQQKDGADTSEAAYLTFQEGKKGDPGENGKDGENGRDGKDGISSVKTDGKTITGDGNTTPLALGPAEPYAVGTYISAMIDASYLYDGRAPTDGSLIERGTVLDMGDVLGTIVDGSLIFPSDTNHYNTYVFHPPGQWISCSSIYISNSHIFAIWRRIR